MKKILLSLILSVGLITLNAQSLKVYLKGTTTDITGTTLTVDSVLNGDIYQTLVCDDVDVINMSASTMKVRCTRTVVTEVSGSENSFCWGTGCYAASVNTSPVLQSPDIAPGGISSTFVGDYKPQLMDGVTTVEYKFFDNANPSDFAIVSVTYTATATGINEAKASGWMSNVYPNPASSMISVKYDMNASAQKGSIVFHDMLGKKVKEVELNDKQGVARINLSDLNDGLYFYTFLVNDKAVSTRKVVLSHK